MAKALKEKTVILINGTGGSGKDTICDILRKHYKTIVISTVDDVKKAAACIGWNGGKEVRDRAFLSDLKDLCTKYYDYPYKQAVNTYEFFIRIHFDILVIHIREPHELEKMRRYIMDDGRASVYTLLVKTRRVTETYGNHADDDVEKYNYDYTFNNDCPLEQLDETFMLFFEGWSSE